MRYARTRQSLAGRAGQDPTNQHQSAAAIALGTSSQHGVSPSPSSVWCNAPAGDQSHSDGAIRARTSQLSWRTTSHTSRRRTPSRISYTNNVPRRGTRTKDSRGQRSLQLNRTRPITARHVLGNVRHVPWQSANYLGNRHSAPSVKPIGSTEIYVPIMYIMLSSLAETPSLSSSCLTETGPGLTESGPIRWFVSLKLVSFACRLAESGPDRRRSARYEGLGCRAVRRYWYFV